MTSTEIREDEWESAAEAVRLKITFDTVGDVFAGVYQGHEEITWQDDTWIQLNFRGMYTIDGASGDRDTEIDGEGCAIQAGAKLLSVFAGDTPKVQPGQVVRITRVADVAVKSQKDKMKDYKVDVRK